MNTVKRSNVHWHITIVFDWKTMTVLSLSTLTWLLMK